MRILLELFGQNWIKTLSKSVTLLFLPLITYIITALISGNIALSLGMVGALLIVRFSNPVRSPLKLTVYFAAIKIGIAAAADIKWIFLLGITTTLICFILCLVGIFYKKVVKKELFINSFLEVNQVSSLQKKVKESILSLDQLVFLESKSLIKGINNYFLTLNDFNFLQKIANNLENNFHVISYELNQ